MADISKIRLENQDYNIKDTTARDDIETLEEIEEIRQSTKTIFLGDSYLDGYSPDGTISLANNYCSVFSRLAGITEFQKFSKGGIGFYQKIDGVNILKLLQNNIGNITNKHLVKNIIVAIGWNDCYSSDATFNAISNEIKDFVEYCNEQFPNGTVYIAQAGYCTSFTENNRNDRLLRLANIVTPAYANTSIVNGKSYVFLDNVQYVLHNSDLMSSDGVHPNVAGHKALAQALYSAYKSQAFVKHTEFSGMTLIDDSNVSSSRFEFYVTSNNNMKQVQISYFDITYSGSYKTLEGGYRTTNDIGINRSKTLRPVHDMSFPIDLRLTKSDDTILSVPALLNFRGDKISLRVGDTVTNIKKIELLSTTTVLCLTDSL